MKTYDIVLCNCTKPFGQENREHLGLAYLASSLEASGYNVLIIDTLIEHLDITSLTKQLEQLSFRFLGLSFLSYGYSYAKELARNISVNKKFYIIIGGHFVSFCLTDIINDGFIFDYAIQGEGEEIFPSLIKILDSGEKPASRIIQGQLTCSLDQLPFPARPYAKRLVESGYPLAISSSRGCYHNCSFCSVNSFYEQYASAKWRARSAQSVVNEISSLYQKYGAISFDFIDDNFVGIQGKGIQRALEMADLLYSMYGDRFFSFSFDTRVENISEELISRWARIGLRYVLIGIESISTHDQQIYKKIISKKTVKKALSILDKYGIGYKIGVILWNPETTVDSVLENYAFFREIQYIIEQPLIKVNMYKGTRIYQNYKYISHGSFDALDWDFLDHQIAVVYDDLFRTIQSGQQLLENKILNGKNSYVIALNNKLIFSVLKCCKLDMCYDTILQEYLTAVRKLVDDGGSVLNVLRKEVQNDTGSNY